MERVLEDIGHIPVCVRVQYPTINCSINFPFLINVYITEGKEHPNMQTFLSPAHKSMGTLWCVSSKA